MDARAEAYRRELAGLPISRMLAQFIKTGGGSGRRSGGAGAVSSRLPHFLEGIDTRHGHGLGRHASSSQAHDGDGSPYV